MLTKSAVLVIDGKPRSVIIRKINKEFDGNAIVTAEIVRNHDDLIDVLSYAQKGIEYLKSITSERSDLIKEVIFNNPATVVFWSDGTKTVVKCQPGDEYNKETGLAMCIAKKYLGNKGNFNEVFKKYIEDYDPRESKEV